MQQIFFLIAPTLKEILYKTAPQQIMTMYEGKENPNLLNYNFSLISRNKNLTRIPVSRLFAKICFLILVEGNSI